MFRKSWVKPGRLVPPSAKRLRSRSIRLAPGQEMPWHSTDRREELLVMLEGVVDLERRMSIASRTLRVSLRAGHCAYLPSGTPHRLVNRSRRRARYLYVTA